MVKGKNQMIKINIHNISVVHKLELLNKNRKDDS